MKFAKLALTLAAVIPCVSANSLKSQEQKAGYFQCISVTNGRTNIYNCTNADVQTVNSQSEIYKNLICDCTYGIRLQTQFL